MRFPVLYGAWAGHFIRGEVQQALKLVLSALELADTQEDSAPRLVANRLVGSSHALGGNFVEARARLEIAEQIYDPEQHRALANRLGHEPGVAVHAYMAIVLWCLGYSDLATTHAESADSMARESAHVLSICHTDLHLGMYAQFRGDAHMVRRHGESIDQLADEYDMTQWRQLSEIFLGWASVALGDESSIHRFQRGIESYTDAGARMFVPIFTTTFASLLLQLDRFEEAHQTISVARRTMQATGQRLVEAELLRVEGDLYLQNSKQAKARACYERSIEAARNQNAKSWELRTTMSLAAFLGERGEKQHAHDLLDGVYGWFSEDLESQDLKKARLLLDQLA